MNNGSFVQMQNYPIQHPIPQQQVMMN